MIYEMPNGTQVDAHQVFYVRPWGKEVNSGTLQQPLLTPRPIFGLPSPCFEPHADKPVIVDLGEDAYDFDRMLSGGFFANNSGQKYELWFVGKMEKTKIGIHYYMPYQTNRNGRVRFFQCVINNAGSHNYTKIDFYNCGISIRSYLPYDLINLATFNNCTFGDPHDSRVFSENNKLFYSGENIRKHLNRCYGVLLFYSGSEKDKQLFEETVTKNNYRELKSKLTPEWFNEDNQPFGVWFGEFAWRYPKDIFVSTNSLKQPENLEVVVKNFDGTSWVTINNQPVAGITQNENWRGTILANQLKPGINILKAKKQQMQIFVDSETLSYIELYPSQLYSTTHNLSTIAKRGIDKIITNLQSSQAIPLVYTIKGVQNNSIITAQIKPNTIKIESR